MNTSETKKAANENLVEEAHSLYHKSSAHERDMQIEFARRMKLNREGHHHDIVRGC